MQLRRPFAIVLSFVALMLAGCDGGKPHSDVEVSLSEWSIEVSSSDIHPGDATFKVTNDGTRPHELVVVRTDLPPQLLPMLASGELDESKVTVVTRLEPQDASAMSELEAEITAGKYLLICNVFEQTAGVSHFDSGMVASITALE